MRHRVARVWIVRAGFTAALDADLDPVGWGGDPMPTVAVCGDPASENEVATVRERFGVIDVVEDAGLGLDRLDAGYVHLVTDPFVEIAASTEHLLGQADGQAFVMGEILVKRATGFRFSALAGLSLTPDDTRVRAALHPESCWVRRDVAECLVARLPRSAGHHDLGNAVASALQAPMSIHRTALILGLAYFAGDVSAEPVDAGDDPLLAAVVAVRAAAAGRRWSGTVASGAVADLCVADCLGWPIVTQIDMTIEDRVAAIAAVAARLFGSAPAAGTLAASVIEGLLAGSIDRAHAISDDADGTAAWRARAAALQTRLDQEHYRARQATRRVQQLKKQLEVRDGSDG